MNALSNLDILAKYSLAPTDDQIRFWMLEVKGHGQSRP